MYIMALASGLIWGVTFSLARIATEAGFHPIGLAWWQAAGGGFVLLLYCLASKQFSVNPTLPRLKHMVIVGLSGTVVPGTLLFYAALYVPAGVLAITIAIVPILTYVFSVLLSLDAVSVQRFTGVVLGFLAILVIMLPGSTTGLSAASTESLLTSPRFWIMAAVVAGGVYTFENLFVDARVPAPTSIPLLLCGSMLVASVLLLPITLATGSFVKLNLPFNTAEWSVIAMMFVSAIAYLLYLLLIKMAGAVFASMSGYVVTLSGVFWGMVFFSESHSTAIWLALILMLVGMALVTPREASNLESTAS